jgi:hypothetical protein
MEGTPPKAHRRRSTFAPQLRQLGDVGRDRSYLDPLLGSFFLISGLSYNSQTG